MSFPIRCHWGDWTLSLQLPQEIKGPIIHHVRWKNINAWSIVPFKIRLKNKSGPGWKHLHVSKNRGTPKSSILIGFSLINHPFWGVFPLFLHTPTWSFSGRSTKTPSNWRNVWQVLSLPLPGLCAIAQGQGVLRYEKTSVVDAFLEGDCAIPSGQLVYEIAHYVTMWIPGWWQLKYVLFFTPIPWGNDPIWRASKSSWCLLSNCVFLFLVLFPCSWVESTY